MGLFVTTQPGTRAAEGSMKTDLKSPFYFYLLGKREGEGMLFLEYLLCARLWHLNAFPQSPAGLPSSSEAVTSLEGSPSGRGQECDGSHRLPCLPLSVTLNKLLYLEGLGSFTCKMGTTILSLRCAAPYISQCGNH